MMPALRRRVKLPRLWLAVRLLRLGRWLNEPVPPLTFRRFVIVATSWAVTVLGLLLLYWVMTRLG
jgi:hypothetical protein